MPTPHTIILIYALAINLIAFAMYAIDKRRAVLGKWRVSEKSLLAVAVAGGSFGAYAGMKIMHHKTSKPAFAIGVPAVMLIQVLLMLWTYLRN